VSSPHTPEIQAALWISVVDVLSATLLSVASRNPRHSDEGLQHYSTKNLQVRNIGHGITRQNTDLL
jgi:hypothetical protein